MSDIKLSERSNFFIMSLAVSAVLLAIGAMSKDIGVVGNIIIIVTFVIATPQLFLSYKRYRDNKEMESKFPGFLRDLTENLRSGMAFHKAIRTASRLDYGKLTPEVKKMANQISWGMPVDKVLNQFAERVKKSRRLYTSLKIIRESYMSGGEVASTIESVADNSTLLEDSQKERKSLLDQYVVLMYAISLIFIVIVTAINRLLVPIFQISGAAIGGESFGLTNPCTNPVDFAVNICWLFQSTSQYYFSLDPNSIGAYYASLFFYMALMQALFSGLVAGQISDNSITAGIKHSLILVGITIGSFSILAKFGLIGV